MTRPIRHKLGLWRDTSKGVKSQLKDSVKDPALKRSDIRTSIVQQKMDRGDRAQAARLRFYPSIDVDLQKLYAGSIEGDLEDAKGALMEAGFRNGPLAYVEVTEEFGPDDGSFWLHIITETGKFPIVENRLSLFRRVKDQIHVVTWLDEDRDMVHFGAHREQSAPLQPARHAIINDANARRGVRDFRNKWFDEFGRELPTPLGPVLPDITLPVEEET